ncbi:MAG: L-2-amino-thiazoline-4-carboxylic acid hydrolase [Sandaracinaceae bacterium]
MTHSVVDLTVRTAKPIVHREAYQTLEPMVGAEAARDVVREAWRRYEVLDHGLPLEPTFGANIMVHLAALTIAFYRALVANGQSPEDARALVAEINWAVYENLTSLPWALTALGGAGTLGRVKRALDLFMVFPYAAPGYDMAYVDEGPGVVGFDVWRCPAAELFEAHGLSALCKEAFCDLDYPLADMWGVELERTHTLSTGGPCCNFRFRDKPTELASKSRGTPEDKT